MPGLRVAGILVLTALMILGCVEEIQKPTNLNPKIWFVEAPREHQLIYENRVQFEWYAVDHDDDLGMGATYISVIPHRVFQIVPQMKGDGYDTLDFHHPEGWYRVYESEYELMNLPDTSFLFQVQVVDGRGASTIIGRNFIVGLDESPPVVDSINCPAGKWEQPTFNHTFIIYAHDVARSSLARTPTDSIVFTWRMVHRDDAGNQRIGFPLEPDEEWSVENKVAIFDFAVALFPGRYMFKYKAMDMAGNETEERQCEFRVEEPKQ